MIIKVHYSNRAIKDIQAIKKSGNNQVIKKLSVLLLELHNHPKTGKGNPKQLHDHGEFGGYWSRRLDTKHRLVYKIDQSSMELVIVTIIAAKGHYDDK